MIARIKHPTISMALAAGILVTCTTFLGGMISQVPPEQDYTDQFFLENARLVPNGRNAYFSLQPGYTLRLEGEDEGELIEVEIKVTDNVRLISFAVDGDDDQMMVVRTRVILEREWADGELTEISRNFFARDTRTGNIYYFGEDVDNYEDGVVVNHDGSWRAGVDGAQPGLIMPATSLIGSRYYQEIAPGIALDRAKHTREGLTVNTPAGQFDNCIMIRESTPLEDGTSLKIYAPYIGLLVDDNIRLVSYGFQD